MVVMQSGLRGTPREPSHLRQHRMPTMIIKQLSYKEIPTDHWDDVIVRATYKVSKTATLKEIAAKLSAKLRIGVRCDCEHDCCGCWSAKRLRVARTKRGEVHATFLSSANV